MSTPVPVTWPRTRRVCAVDPGRTTGLCQAEIMGGKLHIHTFHEARLTERSFSDFLSTYNFDYVVMESFEYRPKHHTNDKLDLFPCYLIGVANLWEQRTDRQIDFQMASEALGGFFKEDKVLSDWGVYYKGGEGHARSATRHLLYWWAFGAGFRLHSGARDQYANVVNLGMTKDAQTEKQKHPTRVRKPRNTGDIAF